MNSIAVVINPIAGGGRGKKVWRVIQPGLNAIFDNVTYGMSNRVDDLASITQGLLETKPDFLLIIGGDGTLNHALNGLIEEDKLRNPHTKIAYFNAGCGGDFARQFPEQHVTEFLDRLTHNQSIHTNVGKITWGNHATRYFMNIASCGLSGHVVLTSGKSRWMKKLGGSINYLAHSLTGLVSYKKSVVRIQIDESPPFECSLLMMAVCNGQFFGGKMHVAPMAKIDDGMLDVVLFRDFTILDAFFKFHKIYSGSHLLDKNVHYVQAKKIRIEPTQKAIIEMEADGEHVGQLPATFELLSETISLII